MDRPVVWSPTHSPGADKSWRMTMRVTLDALADTYSGTDGVWIDELIQASSDEMRIHCSPASEQAEIKEFLQDYRLQLRQR